MTGCRSDRRLLAVVLAACVPVLAPGEVHADDAVLKGWRTVETGEPIQLFPRPGEPAVPPGPARDTVPAHQAPAVDPGQSGGAVVRRDIPVESVVLGEVSADSVGLLDPDKGGLGADMWAGTSRDILETLLEKLPSEVNSPTLRALAVRLLLSRATVPPADEGGKSLIAIRVDRLLALGEVGGAVALLEAGPPVENDPARTRVEVDSRFLHNDNAGACAKTREVAGAFEGDYWQKALAYCLALSGEIERAAIITDILREHGAAEQDPAFFPLVEALGGAEAATAADGLAEPDGLHVSLLRAANARLPAKALETSRLAVLKAAAFSPNVELEMRLPAVERLATAGALTSGELADLYNSVPFTTDELSNPVAFAAGNWGPRGRALMIRAATLAQTPDAKIALLKAAGTVANKHGGGEDLVVRASAPMLKALKPSRQLLVHARDIAWRLYAAGELDAAAAWFELVVVNSQTVPAADRAWTELWPLAQLGDVKGEMIWDDTRLAGWWQWLKKARKDGAHVTATMVYSLLEAAGYRIDGAAWAALVGGAQTASAGSTDTALWRALEDASANGRRGETVLYSLLALGKGGAELANPMATAAVVRALRRVGLDREARGLAVEAAIAVGA